MARPLAGGVDRRAQAGDRWIGPAGLPCPLLSPRPLEPVHRGLHSGERSRLRRPHSPELPWEGLSESPRPHPHRQQGLAAGSPGCPSRSPEPPASAAAPEKPREQRQPPPHPGVLPGPRTTLPAAPQPSPALPPFPPAALAAPLLFPGTSHTLAQEAADMSLPPPPRGPLSLPNLGGQAGGTRLLLEIRWSLCWK
ncbi:hypothetical protein mRhiFer1_009512 [Rhinolophus ferrumequinum]|uniref:Uncharacterized protein n=1 Tax=Rhinolophus ferrumequinum TaxID=59479 RepID=A0A7J7RAW2_RHIFE|nr:hypothetical protein mRhiFer1_009512 [Rhinolophus ferrumequinum]